MCWRRGGEIISKMPRKFYSADAMKHCSRCKRLLSIDEFNYSSTKGVKDAWCKLCIMLKRWYGMRFEDYALLYNRQLGVCAICKQPQRSRKTKYLTIDHDHITGEIRGLLCGHCNTGLGGFRDSVEFLAEAMLYLQQPRLPIQASPKKMHLPAPTELTVEVKVSLKTKKKQAMQQLVFFEDPHQE